MNRFLKQLSLGLLVASLFLSNGRYVLAQAMTSTNYRIPFDAFSEGGGRSTSTNYITEDTLAENSSPTGEDLSSTNYLACVGYECLLETPFMTVTYAVQATPCTGTSASSPPYDVPLGTLTTASVSTASNRICVRVTTNSADSVVVQGSSANAALKSTSVPTDTISSGTAILTAGVSGYGFCSSNAQDGFTASSPFNGVCDTSGNHSVGGMTVPLQTIWSATGPITDAYGELLTKAAISSGVPGHADYTDTLRIIVTGTY